jgi:hypothetical protein
VRRARGKLTSLQFYIVEAPALNAGFRGIERRTSSFLRFPGG